MAGQQAQHREQAIAKLNIRACQDYTHIYDENSVAYSFALTPPLNSCFSLLDFSRTKARPLRKRSEASCQCLRPRGVSVSPKKQKAHPPSTTTVVALINDPPSDARKSTVYALRHVSPFRICATMERAHVVHSAKAAHGHDFFNLGELVAAAAEHTSGGPAHSALNRARRNAHGANAVLRSPFTATRARQPRGVSITCSVQKSTRTRQWHWS